MTISSLNAVRCPERVEHGFLGGFNGRQEEGIDDRMLLVEVLLQKGS
jgi:hypothetical protein